MELCPKNLTELFQERKSKMNAFTISEVQKYMNQIIKATRCLHSHGFLHRDIKPDNILVSEKGVLKLTDFGTIKKLKDKLPFTNYVSTRWYRAPE